MQTNERFLAMDARHAVAVLLLALAVPLCTAPAAGAVDEPPPAAPAASSDSPAVPPPAADPPAGPEAKKTSPRSAVVIASLTIFVLAIFVGFEVITKVPPTLHTPLMSGSNAISGITVVGALLVAGLGAKDGAAWYMSVIGAAAIALGMINVVGGFLVTHRMLSMFRPK
jgi:NAD(P) transhydrogenase subunit alpha